MLWTNWFLFSRRRLQRDVMQGNDLAEGISDLNVTDEHEKDVSTAATRLAKEARQALYFGGRGTRDVTQIFSAASKLLPPGQLVKDEFFTLFDAVGALEITDPKMDSGYVPPGDTFEADFDPCSILSVPQILWIMDQLLGLEIMWQNGYPLSQTIFTSLHIDRLLAPDNSYPYTFNYGQDPVGQEIPQLFMVHTVLRSYCLALIKSCQLALHWIKSQTYFEEEDFVTHLFGRDLLPRAGINEIIDLLESTEKSSATQSLPDEIREALLARLQLRKFYLLSAGFEEQYWSDTLPQLLTVVHRTHGLVEAIPSAFSEKVQRQLASSTPPRPMLTTSWEEAIKDWRKLFSDISEANNLIRVPIIQSPHCLQLATWAFSRRAPQPNTFARTRLQDLLCNEQSVAQQVTHYDLLLTDLRDLVLAGDSLADVESFQIEATFDPRHVASRIMEEFLDKALDEYLNLYRIVCQNLCRMRRTFAQSITILDLLETEAIKFDERLRKVSQQPGNGHDVDGKVFNPLTSWVKFYKLRTMAWTIQLGFETDIYLPHELGTMYWFLLHLSTERGSLLDRIQSALINRMRLLARSKDASAAAECLSSQDWLQSLTIQSDLTLKVAEALWKLYTILTSLGIITPPKHEFAQQQLLYELRMKPFLPVINDPPPTCSDFVNATILNGTLTSTCDGINNTVKNAKQLLAELKRFTPEQAKYIGTEDLWRKEIKQLETTCVAIAVSTSQLLRIAEKYQLKDAKAGDDLGRFIDCSIPSPGPKRYHDWWVVPLLTEKAI